MRRCRPTFDTKSADNMIPKPVFRYAQQHDIVTGRNPTVNSADGSGCGKHPASSAARANGPTRVGVGLGCRCLQWELVYQSGNGVTVGVSVGGGTGVSVGSGVIVGVLVMILIGGGATKPMVGVACATTVAGCSTTGLCLVATTPQQKGGDTQTDSQPDSQHR